MPPSTTTSTPVTYELSSDARNSATFATSSGRPRRPNSVLPSMAAAHSGSFNCLKLMRPSAEGTVSRRNAINAAAVAADDVFRPLDGDAAAEDRSKQLQLRGAESLTRLRRRPDRAVILDE